MSKSAPPDPAALAAALEPVFDLLSRILGTKTYAVDEDTSAKAVVHVTFTLTEQAEMQSVLRQTRQAATYAGFTQEDMYFAEGTCRALAWVKLTNDFLSWEEHNSKSVQRVRATRFEVEYKYV